MVNNLIEITVLNINNRKSVFINNAFTAIKHFLKIIK